MILATFRILPAFWTCEVSPEAVWIIQVQAVTFALDNIDREASSPSGTLHVAQIGVAEEAEFQSLTQRQPLWNLQLPVFGFNFESHVHRFLGFRPTVSLWSKRQ